MQKNQTFIAKSSTQQRKAVWGMASPPPKGGRRLRSLSGPTQTYRGPIPVSKGPTPPFRAPIQTSRGPFRYTRGPHRPPGGPPRSPFLFSARFYKKKMFYHICKMNWPKSEEKIEIGRGRGIEKLEGPSDSVPPLQMSGCAPEAQSKSMPSVHDFYMFHRFDNVSVERGRRMM